MQGWEQIKKKLQLKHFLQYIQVCFSQAHDRSPNDRNLHLSCETSIHFCSQVIDTPKSCLNTTRIMKRFRFAEDQVYSCLFTTPREIRQIGVKYILFFADIYIQQNIAARTLSSLTSEQAPKEMFYCSTIDVQVCLFCNVFISFCLTIKLPSIL